MLTASPITNQPVGKTFTIAISILGVGAMLQLVLIGWAFVNRARNGAPPIVATVTPAGLNPTARVGVSQPAGTGTVAANHIVEPDAVLTTTPAPSTDALEKPKPISKRPVVPDPMNRFDELVLQGKQLREQSDTTTAIIKFREAMAIDPKNPMPVAELATTYDKMGLLDKSGENWRKILEMGPEAGGVYYTLAQAMLKATQEHAIRVAAGQSTGGAAPTPAQTLPDTAIDTSTATENIAAGAMLGLMPIRAEDERDDASFKRLLLHIPIKARPKAHIEVKDLVIHVLFYDIVEGQNVVQTSANVNYKWATTPADWLDTDTEELAAEYQLPKPEARSAKRENRKYYGYIVRIYYKQQLQAATAEPSRLAQQYPPPPTLPKENDK
jgi:hypothetical protein